MYRCIDRGDSLKQVRRFNKWAKTHVYTKNPDISFHQVSSTLEMNTKNFVSEFLSLK